MNENGEARMNVRSFVRVDLDGTHDDDNGSKIKEETDKKMFKVCFSYTAEEQRKNTCVSFFLESTKQQQKKKRSGQFVLVQH